MSAIRRVREADCPLVERVTEVTYDEQSREWAWPDTCWDLVVFKKGGATMVMQTGLTTRPTLLENGPGDSFLAISFKPGVFVARAPGIRTVDTGIFRPLVSARVFAMENERLEIPSFENAEHLVQRLARRELLVRDDLVASIADGRPYAATPRSKQRRFMSVLGMTPKQFEQIQRASRALELLRGGMSLASVATEAGYSDQPHLTRSLKAIMGRTPGELLRGGAP